MEGALRVLYQTRCSGGAIGNENEARWSFAVSHPLHETNPAKDGAPLDSWRFKIHISKRSRVPHPCEARVGYTGCGKTRRSNKPGARACITRDSLPQVIERKLTTEPFFRSLYSPGPQRSGPLPENVLSAAHFPSFSVLPAYVNGVIHMQQQSFPSVEKA